MGKASIINMVKWLAQELIDDNIRVNAIAPGFTRTNMMDESFGMNNESLLPPKAVANPDEIASAACLICSPNDGKFINGETFVLSGGHPSPKFSIKKLAKL